MAIGIAMAMTLLTSIAIANANNPSVQDMKAHHQGGGMMGMMNMMNGNGINIEEMHEQCESSMTEEAHEQCEAIMEESGCPMMG